MSTKSISTSSSSGSSSSVRITDSKVENKAPTKWLSQIYNTSLFTEEEITRLYDDIKFIGFNRDEMLSKLADLIDDPKVAVEAILVCSLRGPRKAENVKLSNGKTLRQMGIPASDQKGTKNLSCQRISSSTADLAAFYFKKLKVPKRIEMDLPGWLQFPTAGSIKMPPEVREKHKIFNKVFSEKIGGEFNEDIYNQMVQNAYLDENLNLFH